MSPFLAVDWGTTNRRLFVIDGGKLLATERDDKGILSAPDFDQEMDALTGRFGNMPIMLAGMVGSNRGWREVAYVPAPASLADLARAAVHPRPDVVIVPGVSYRGSSRFDVMRGEEVQLLGATASGLVPSDAIVCQPGTHCKWARMRSGQLADFITAMTGEMFALLKKHALIGQDLIAPVENDDAFRAGVEEAARGDLLASLFGVRAAIFGGSRQRSNASSFVSGLLIGTDVRAHARSGETVYLLADPVLAGFYTSALESIGAVARVVDSTDAFVAGISGIKACLQ